MRILWQNYFMLFQLDNVAETNIESVMLLMVYNVGNKWIISVNKWNVLFKKWMIGLLHKNNE